MLGGALLAFAALSGGIMLLAPDTSYRFSAWALHGTWTWLFVMMMFMIVGTVAQRLAFSPVSRSRQLFGLGLAVVAQAVLLQPLLWMGLLRFGAANEGMIVSEAIIVTLVIFTGLTLTVFLTRKDFSFMRGVLTIASFAVIGVIIASLIFGFTLGAVFMGLVILLMSGYVLYQTSIMMTQFPPQAHVAAALMLFSTIATLFWYVLMLLMEMNGGRRR